LNRRTWNIITRRRIAGGEEPKRRLVFLYKEPKRNTLPYGDRERGEG
jgi:hypothetical protein